MNEIEQGQAEASHFEWGAIEAEAVRRVGVVDVGSNSVRLVVFDGVARSPAYFYNEKILCGLGAGLQETGKLNPEGRARALRALTRFVALARVMKVSQLSGVATAAVREATDGPAFVAEVRDRTGMRLHVASGEEEAQLSAKGVLLGWPHATGMVCDIGGASMELARVDDGQIGARGTSPLGPLRLANLGGEAEIAREIGAGVKRLHEAVTGAARKLYLVGGSWRAIARLDMERRHYPLKVLHEYRMTPDEVIETCDWIAGQTPEQLSQHTDTSMARLELVPLASRVLKALIGELQPQSLSVSSYGLREGMLYELMPDTLRAKDPLLEASRHMERQRARFPGFGKTLYHWLGPLYRRADPARQRLVRAACHLHDITWRTHPDYRAEVCFETVTRANLSGVDHEGRVFLALAILNRYKNSRKTAFADDLIALLSETRVVEAETLGRAIRLGAMLSGAAPGTLEQTALRLDDTTLTLVLKGRAAELQGEAVERRLAALAATLGRDPVIEIDPAV